ncbi:hypothetical protein BH10ACT11_BH10ACT11_08290 [soil metagenome]
MLVALALGLAAYALFRLVEVFTGAANEDGAKDVLERAASVVRFVIYGTLCVSAVRVIANAGASSGNEDKTTSTVFDLPAGVVIVFGAGAVMVGVGLYQAYNAATASFEDSLEMSKMSPAMRSTTHRLGIAGHAARSVVFVLIGGFLIKAAVEQKSSEAIGLDGALKEISQQSYGSVLLFIVAAGLLIFGAYSLIEARYRKL